MIGPTVYGNTIGSDHQNFNFGNSFVDYFTVHSAKTLGKNQFSLGLGANHGVNTLPYFGHNQDSVDIDREYNDGITTVDLNLAVGILENLDLSLALPYIVHQELTETYEFHGEFDRLGNTEIRGGIKYQFLKYESFSLALVGTLNYNRVNNNPYTGDEDWPAYSAELVGEYNYGNLNIATNFGYRWRRSGETIEIVDETPIEPFSNQWLFSTAVEYKLPETKIGILGEIYGNYTNEDISLVSPRNASALETVAGLRYHAKKNLIFQAGLGAEMRHSVSSADRRYFAGVLWRSELPKRKKAKEEPLPEPVKEYRAPVVIELEDIQFAFDSSAINYKTEKAKLDQLKSIVSQYEGIEKIVVEGHACKIGSDAYNMGLSERRADTVLDWLVDGIQVPREKVIPVGYGERNPVVSNETREGRVRNRRVRFEVFYK